MLYGDMGLSHPLACMVHIYTCVKLVPQISLLWFPSNDHQTNRLLCWAHLQLANGIETVIGWVTFPTFDFLALYNM